MFGFRKKNNHVLWVQKCYEKGVENGILRDSLKYERKRALEAERVAENYHREWRAADKDFSDLVKKVKFLEERNGELRDENVLLEQEANGLVSAKDKRINNLEASVAYKDDEIERLKGKLVRVQVDAHNWLRGNDCIGMNFHRGIVQRLEDIIDTKNRVIESEQFKSGQLRSKLDHSQEALSVCVDQVTAAILHDIKWNVCRSHYRDVIINRIREGKWEQYAPSVTGKNDADNT